MIRNYTGSGGPAHSGASPGGPGNDEGTGGGPSNDMGSGGSGQNPLHFNAAPPSGSGAQTQASSSTAQETYGSSTRQASVGWRLQTSCMNCDTTVDNAEKNLELRCSSSITSGSGESCQSAGLDSDEDEIRAEAMNEQLCAQRLLHAMRMMPGLCEDLGIKDPPTHITPISKQEYAASFRPM